MDTETKKPSKLVVTLLLFIILSALYLGYVAYKSNAELDRINQDNVTVETDNSLVNLDTPTTNVQYTIEDIASRNSQSSCWTIVDGIVYDITSYIPNHPGGEAEIVQVCGKDGTALFSRVPAHQSADAKGILSSFKIGVLQ